MTIQVTLSRPAGASAPRIPDGGVSRRGHADGVILNGVIGAVVFDLDGVLIDSEQEWEDARRAVVVRHGGAWRDGAAGAMRGMSSPEWAAYLRDDLGVDLEPGQIVELVVGEVLDRLREDPRVVPGADRVLEELGGRWPLALASSANRVVIDAVLERARWADRFAVTVSAEEVARGKPAPDVYLEAVRRLAEAPGRCAAIEDSTNGLRAALAPDSSSSPFRTRTTPRPTNSSNVPISSSHGSASSPPRAWRAPMSSGRSAASVASTKKSASRSPPRTPTRTGQGRPANAPCAASAVHRGCRSRC